MSFIFAPSMTAVLNSVEDEKSGVPQRSTARSVRCAPLLGIAILGTVMSRAYLSAYNASPDIQGLRSGPAAPLLQPVLDLVGSGIGFAGRLIEDPRLVQFGDALGRVRDASASAFMNGMRSAIIVSGVAAAATGILAYLLIDDRVTAPSLK
jgi:hypothetical protein